MGIRDQGIPVLAFGEDGAGEVYILQEAVRDQGIYRLEQTESGEQ